jgi:ferredoxin/flavodoxin---NADP+ reductase
MPDHSRRPTNDIVTDVVIVGAGPVGLYGAYCAGFRGLRVVVIDSLPAIGGQVAALYPDKIVRDVAGIPSLPGRDLVDGLAAQAAQFDPLYLLSSTAATLHPQDCGLRIALDDGTVVAARGAVITAGIGTFSPRPLEVGEEYLGRGLSYLVADLDAYRGARVVVVGGGDSALDWALAVQPVAASVTVVHRRARFRAHAASVAEAVARGIDLRLDSTIEELAGSDRLEKARIATRGGHHEYIEVNEVIAALGFVSDLGVIADWGVELSGRHVRTDQRLRTSVPLVYAAGDVADYPGKVRLMSVGFGEVATAVGNLAVEIDPELTLFPGHSTDHAVREEKIA